MFAMSRNPSYVTVFLALVLGLTLTTGCAILRPPAKDEAKSLGKSPADFPQTAVDMFREMDGGITLTEDEIKGRNTWMIWTAGNQAFWDYLAGDSFGNLDLLKTLSSFPSQKYYYSRDNRFTYLGLMNEPGCRKPTKESAKEKYGLWLDECPSNPEGIDPDIYGTSSGILGLRLFPNPAFKGKAKERWDAERYYTDPEYYLDPDLVRPYRVGMACAFCHVGPHPEHPPADPNNPKWENLSTNVGSQYFWIGRIFLPHQDPENFVWQLFNTSPPGALDTSLIATDNINNPRTMNAIYEVGARLSVAEQEKLTGGSLNIKDTTPLKEVPHILKDGADSVGILGALNRVYINIGAYHQEWIRHFNRLIGGKPQTPLDVATAQENSVYWVATEQRVENLAKFFLKAAGAHHLQDAPGGGEYLTQDQNKLAQGKIVFAEHCAACHSSKLPEPPTGIQPYSSEYEQWVESSDFTSRMKAMALKPDFRDNNFFSNDHRYPISKIGTNACASLATNGLRDHIWDNFTSETYKTLPAVGTIDVQHPLDGTVSTYQMPGGGRGYLRSPSLVSMWSTAPYFHNNALGKFTNDPSVKGRMEAFQDGVEKLLWPEKRHDTQCQTYWGLPWCPPIYKTTQVSYLKVNRAFLPEILQDKLLAKGEKELRLGPIPKGTPINLLANINNELSFEPGRLIDLVDVVIKIKKTLIRIEKENLNEEQSTALLKTLVPELLEVNKCPDFVIDRGHTYGSKLSDSDKEALIEFLKTL